MKISDAVKLMKRGKLVIYPTESSYAIGCDATNTRAIKKIKKLKGRKSGKFFPVIVSDINMVKKYYKIDRKIERIARLGVTIICKKKRKMLHIGGFRISKDAIARNIAKKLGKPLVATSANISGKKALYNSKEIRKIFPTIPIIDVGNLPKRKPSTVYDYDNRKLLRKGPVSLKQIERLIR